MQDLKNKIIDMVLRYRKTILTIFAIITVLMAVSATRLGVDAGFYKMVPLEHEYMKVFREYEKSFGGANRVLVALMQKDGDIFNPKFFTTLRNVTDDVFFIPGVDRATVTSLFTPNVRFIEVVEEGFAGGTVMPADFKGTPQDLERVRKNILKSGAAGRLVSNDFRGALVRAELMETDPVSGQRLDYQSVSRQLEAIREKYEKNGITVHIIGFAKAVGDIADGARGVVVFFGLAFVIIFFMLYYYTGSFRLVVPTIVSALAPVVWLLGLLPVLGYGIDPMSILVPFLLFSIAVSHAVQMTNAWKSETLRGEEGTAASKTALRNLLTPGIIALATDALGFFVILHIKIDMVRELGITATLGLLLMIITNMLLLPVLLSSVRLDQAALARLASREGMAHRIWRRMVIFERPRFAAMVLLLSAVALAGGLWKARDLKTGDLGKGVPELRDDSRYNIDTAAIVDNFAIGVDVLSVIAQSYNVDGACTSYEIMDTIDRFEWHIRNVEGVQSVLSLPGLAKIVNAGWNEGSIKWRALPRNKFMLAQSVSPIDTGTGLLNTDCSSMQIMIFTKDHQGGTISRIVSEVKNFNREHRTDKLEFLLAGGNVGVMAATNEAVDAAESTMLASVFGAIILLCLVTFRSLRATICIVLPLALVTVLAKALMAALGIGLKVSTLPVLALGVGVGVDYGIYLYERMKQGLQKGHTIFDAFYEALRQRGSAVLFTAATMTIGVGSWAFSALKFQSDMGILLAFMFFVNMLGALIMLPALAVILYGRKAGDKGKAPTS